MQNIGTALGRSCRWRSLSGVGEGNMRVTITAAIPDTLLRTGSSKETFTFQPLAPCSVLEKQKNGGNKGRKGTQIKITYLNRLGPDLTVGSLTVVAKLLLCVDL